MEISGNIINAFIVIFDNFNVSLLTKSIQFFKKNKMNNNNIPQTFFEICVIHMILLFKLN